MRCGTTQDGTSFPVEYTSTPIVEDGALQGAVVVFRDVTARKDTEAQLQVALDDVQALTRRLEAGNVYLQEEIRERHHFGTSSAGRRPSGRCSKRSRRSRRRTRAC
jgi:hypothetical protein